MNQLSELSQIEVSRVRVSEIALCEVIHVAGLGPFRLQYS